MQNTKTRLTTTTHKRTWLLLAFIITTSRAAADVNMKDGSFMTTRNDLIVDGPGPALELRRNYDSRSLYAGLFGIGWCWEFEKKLNFHSGSSPRREHCSRPVPGGLTASKDFFEHRAADGTTERYDRLGRLVMVFQGKRKLDFIFDPQGRVRGVIGGAGGALFFSYEGDSTLRSVHAITGREVHYKIEQGLLRESRDSERGVELYTYDRLQNLIKAEGPRGFRLDISYDDDRDLVKQVRRDGCQEDFVFEDKDEGDQRRRSARATRLCPGLPADTTSFVFHSQRQESGFVLTRLERRRNGQQSKTWEVTSCSQNSSRPCY